MRGNTFSVLLLFGLVWGVSATYFGQVWHFGFYWHCFGHIYKQDCSKVNGNFDCLFLVLFVSFISTCMKNLCILALIFKQCFAMCNVGCEQCVREYMYLI